MTTMDQIHRIRELYYGQGKSLTEIAKLMDLDWRTVRKSRRQSWTHSNL